MPDDRDQLSPATPEDVADALAFALRFQGRKRIHNADEIMAEIVAKRLVELLQRAGFVIMQRTANSRGAALGRGFEGYRDPAHHRGRQSNQDWAACALESSCSIGGACESAVL